jgi:AcrR family transcriptional regulator
VGGPRLTRDEKKAQTREKLLDAATRVFARRGFAAASLDEVAEEAGLTKGAVYSQFGSKDDLVIALFEERLDTQTLRIASDVDSSLEIADQAEAAGRMLEKLEDEARDLFILQNEFYLHAIRNPDFHPAHRTRTQRLRADIVKMVEEGAANANVPLTLPSDQVATVMNALALGLGLFRLEDRDSVPDGLYGRAIALFMRGMVAEAADEGSAEPEK